MVTATKFGVFGTMASQFGKLFRRRRLTPRQEARIERAVVAVVEGLESRWLLACNFAGGVLSDSGTSGADEFIVWQSTFSILGGAVGVAIRRVGAGDCAPELASSVTQVLVSALGGDDTISVDRDDAFQLSDPGGVDEVTLLLGGSGNDVIDGGDFADTIWGGDQDSDVIRGWNGNDLEYGGYGGADNLFGNDGNDTMYGGDGANNQTAGDEDALDGGNGTDFLYGEYGGDTLTGGNSADELFGGDGNDEFHTIGDSAADSVFGGNGTDTDTDRDLNDILNSIEVS